MVLYDHHLRQSTLPVAQGNPVKAGPLYRRSLAIREKATSNHNITWKLYWGPGRAILLCFVKNKCRGSKCTKFIGDAIY